MKPFNSFLATQLVDYVAYRRSLGFSTNPLDSHLRAFDRYLAKRKKKPAVLEPSFFLEMRAELDMESRSVNRVLSSVRMFFGYLVRRGHYTANPVKEIPLLPENEIIPFIFSAEQVDQLLLAVCAAGCASQNPCDCSGGTIEPRSRPFISKRPNLKRIA